MKVEDFVDPLSGRTWGELGARVLSAGNQVSVTLGYPVVGLADQLSAQLAEFLEVDGLDLDLRFAAPRVRRLVR